MVLEWIAFFVPDHWTTPLSQEEMFFSPASWTANPSHEGLQPPGSQGSPRLQPADASRSSELGQDEDKFDYYEARQTDPGGGIGSSIRRIAAWSEEVKW